MELLAPVGTPENFFAALDAGADAVYVGAPGLNARNLARDLRMEEIGAMIRVCHDRGRRLYVAANSLILEGELPKAVETLAVLETMGPDALIVQDLGLIHIARQYFPRLPLHASTLMFAHNVAAVKALSAFGCQRVVLARELTLKEIAAIAAKTDVPLEVFVHGAMCFSYSGLCLFSSYLGGKSGLRGRCVQPCRRRYQWHGRGGKDRGRDRGGSYLFSMNDLSGIEALPTLRQIGVASVKIEGRLRSAHYVSHVVQAYRLMLDATPQGFDAALAEAKALVDRAMGRRLAPGYFLSPQPKEAITPYHSGNTGIHLGRIKNIARQKKGDYGLIVLKEPVTAGDRLRLHFEASGERKSFRLKEIMAGNKTVRYAGAGNQVRLLLPAETEFGKPAKIEVYKVDVPTVSDSSASSDLPVQEVKRELARKRKMLVRDSKHIQAELGLQRTGKRADSDDTAQPQGKRTSGRKGRQSGADLELWLKTDSVNMVLGKLPFAPDRLLLTMDKKMLAQAGRIRQYLGRRSRDVIWTLPPVLIGAESGRIRKGIASLIRSGFRSFQIAHISQISLFQRERVHLSGDYTLNLMNDQSVRVIGQSGLEAVQLSIELDRESLRRLIHQYKTGSRVQEGMGGRRETQLGLGLTVFAAPALFTARIAADHFQYDRVLTSPKGETFTLCKQEGGTSTLPCRPFSLLPYLRELKEMGLGYGVVDITGLSMDKKGRQDLSGRLTGTGRAAKLPTFNYLGKLE